MSEEKEDEGVSEFLSTYQWVTVGQLLEGYGFKLPDTCVLDILREKSSFYYQMLRIPVMNVLNGIIIDQTKAYQIFIQKLFVDYLVSGEADVEETIGSETRAALEIARQQMVELSEKFEETESIREKLIVESQRELIAWIEEFKGAIKLIRIALMDELYKQTGEQTNISMSTCYSLFTDAHGFEIQEKAWNRFAQGAKVNLTQEIKATLQDHVDSIYALETPFNHFLEKYVGRVSGLRAELNLFRKQFYHDIAHVQNLLVQLSSFKFNEASDKKERARLAFDSGIGADDEFD
jgi:hypothetical protein